jgi:ketosteroid isomerase-like protein
MQSQMKAPMVFTLTGTVAEGNKVAVETESTGHLTKGRTYNQRFHFLLEFSGGKICAVREYLDTQHAYNVWYAKF